MAGQTNMLKYILKRLLIMVPTLFGVLILMFLLPRMLAGDPVLFMIPIGADEEVRLAEIARLGKEQTI